MKPDLYVTARLLHHLRQGPQGRGDLQAASRLNYDQLVRYLDHLVERGLAEPAGTSGRKAMFRITLAGEKAYADLLAWLARWVGPESHLRP